jgi:N utilization substance protein B
MTASNQKGVKSTGPKSGLRRDGREAAVQYLFQLDQQGFENTTPDGDFWRLRATSAESENPQPPPIAPKARAFAESLVSGVCLNQAAIDELIVRFAQNYQLQRLAAVDRSILRLSVYELVFSREAPPAVAINEAIEIAKRFGSEESGRFVNGLLDRIRKEVPRRPPMMMEDSKSANHPPLLPS